ncbi:MAG: 5-carboxymethyl-2-hydroxymuconate Delta-isomerase [Burkholderiales bacterium]|nr:5-carboxymethyl-2-hydroxymuconate Delta-isomerase [Burkholderiales bacterium]
MPHLVLEHSANLGPHPGEAPLDTLVHALAGVLIAQRDADGQPVYPLGGVRVRAIACAPFCIADGRDADAAFVHARLAIGASRSDAVKRATGDALFDAIRAHFAARFAARGLALSLEIVEFAESGTWKHNNLHARLRDR